MKNIKLLAVLFISSIIVTSCSDSDPEHIHDEEVITTMKVVLTPETGDPVTLEWKNVEDHEEEGHEEGEHEEEHGEPEITGGTLMANTTYSAVITLLNENEDPADNITLEVIEEAEEHQFFYTASGIESTFMYNEDDIDTDGNPLGVKFTVKTGATGTGSYTIILKHEPIKNGDNVADGDMTNAGGETDIEATFPITVSGR